MRLILRGYGIADMAHPTRLLLNLAHSYITFIDCPLEMSQSCRCNEWIFAKGVYAGLLSDDCFAKLAAVG